MRENKPNKYLVWVKSVTNAAGAPDWAWDLAYSGDNELDAVGKYAELKKLNEEDEVVLTKQVVIALEEV